MSGSIGNANAGLYGGGGASVVSVGGNVIPTVPANISEFNGTAGKTFIVKIPGRGIAQAAKAWSFVFHVMVSGVMTIDSLVVAVCDLDSTVVNSFHNISVGATFAPLNLAVGDYTTDAIPVPLDGEHDYYVMFYFDPATVNPNIGNTGSGDWISYLYGLGGSYANSIEDTFLTTYLYPTSGSGDATAMNPVPILSSTALGPKNIIEQVVTA
jgi:hypothetical protein